MPSIGGVRIFSGIAHSLTPKLTFNFYESPRFSRNVIGCSWHGEKIHIMNVDSSLPKTELRLPGVLPGWAEAARPRGPGGVTEGPDGVTEGPGGVTEPSEGGTC